MGDVARAGGRLTFTTYNVTILGELAIMGLCFHTAILELVLREKGACLSENQRMYATVNVVQNESCTRAAA